MHEIFILIYSGSLFLQNVSFNTTFYASPAVLVSVHHYYDRKMKTVISPENNIVTAWVEVRWGTAFSNFNSTLTLQSS